MEIMNGVITYVSPQIKSLHYLEPSKMLGTQFTDLVYPDDLQSIVKSFRDALENSIKPVTFRFYNGKCQVRWGYVSGRPIFENNVVKGVRAVVSDITEIKHAEEELLKLSIAVEQSPASIIITDLKGNIEYVNSRFTQVTGYTADEVMGKNPRLLRSGVTQLTDFKDLWSKISNGNEWKGEFYNRKKNGEFYWEAASISPIINKNNQITHFISVQEDITEKKESTKKLYDKIFETEERERSRYSNELHDGLGPIISTIRLYFEMLAENSDKDQHATIVSKANMCIDEAFQTIKEISHNLSPKVLNRFGLVSGIQNYISRLNETEKLFIIFESNISFRLESNIELTIYRVITELINNTVKYAKASRAELVIDYDEPRSLISVTYSDNGIGFNMLKVKRESQGHGLSNIHYRITNLNGKISYKTSRGKGVRVNFDLPIAKESFSPISE